MRRWWGITVQVMAWTVIVAAGGVLCIAVLVPRLAGATPHAVLTGSMQPGLPPGSLVVTRPASMSDISAGDVIAYQLRSGDPTVVTHRVVATGIAASGDQVLVTQGDANRVADPEPVRDVQLRGRVWYAVPHLGRASTVLPGSTRSALTVVVGAGLAIYAAAMFTSALADRRRVRNEQDRTREAGAHRS